METKTTTNQEQHCDCLEPEDIPGSDLNLTKLSSYRVDELKFWLKCRGDSLKKLPTKAACIQRINEYVKNGQEKIVIDPSPNKIYSRGKELQNESKDSSRVSCSTNTFIEGDYWKIQKNSLSWPWGKDLSGMPPFTIRELEDFFYMSGKTAKTKKRADNMLADNFLDNIFCCHQEPYFYIKAICSASYRKNTFHQLSCCISSTTAQVKYAFCSCVAGIGGFCNHIYALLKLVCQFALDKLDTIPELLPCTSRPCGWTVPKIRKTNAIKPTVMETVVKKAKLDKNSPGVKCTLYEARSTNSQSYPFRAIENLKHSLKNINPLIPLVHGLRENISDQEWVSTKFGRVPIYSMQASQCSKYGNNFNAYYSVDVFSTPYSSTPVTIYPDFPHRNIPIYFSSPLDLGISEINTLEQLKVTNDEAKTIEEATRNQSSNASWHNLRKLRLTASRIDEVFRWKRGMENHGEKFVNHTLDTSNPVLQRKLAHGKMYEPVAWKKYKECMESDLNINITVLPCGLVVDPNNVWLGCSPDARLICGNEIGIGESKCPEQYKNCDVYDVAKSSNSFMLLVNDDNKLDIRKDHSTYTQIQCQLALTGAQYCDLVVYTFRSIAIVRVKFDRAFWGTVVNNVGNKYFNFILPKF